MVMTRLRGLVSVVLVSPQPASKHALFFATRSWPACAFRAVHWISRSSFGCVPLRLSDS